MSARVSFLSIRSFVYGVSRDAAPSAAEKAKKVGDGGGEGEDSLTVLP